MKFATLVVDPPWKVAAGRTIGRYVREANGSQLFGVVDDKARKLAYNSMTLEQIASLELPAADDAHLYLWTINKYLRYAFNISEAWGFRYSTTLVWTKNPIGGGLGGPYGISTEFCLFCRRGTLRTKGRIPTTHFNWLRPYDLRGKPRHSAKPPGFFSMVEAVSPGPYAELFARDRRTGWNVWGDEVECDFNVAKRGQGGES